MKQIIILETDACTYAAQPRRQTYKVGTKVLLNNGVVAEITNISHEPLTYMVENTVYTDMVNHSEILGKYLGIVTDFKYK